VFFSVFYTDMHLKLIQPFTNDRARLKAAVEKGLAGVPTDYANSLADFKAMEAQTNGGTGAADAAALGDRGAGVNGGNLAAEAMNKMITEAMEFAETATREQAGRSSVFALWGIVKEQGRLPGRKTLLYFSEGLQVPQSVHNQFRNMMAAANRSNVAIYPIDARGLSVTGDNQLGNEMINKSTKVSQGQYRSQQTGEQMSREMDRQFDRIQDAIRSNPQVMLQELAESTGGFLMANTNDFRQPLRKLTEELSTYYELVYRPVDTALDGRFRSIEVKVSRPDVRIQSRSGYYAVPTVDGQTVLPHEVPLLSALAAKPLPRGIDFRASAVGYRPAADGTVQTQILFDMPMAGITFRENAEKTAYRTHFSFLALLKDAQGHVVSRIGRDLPMEEPVDKLKGFQQGRAIFNKQVILRPGRYTLEAAVADREGEKIAARRVSVMVPARAEKSVAVSGITLVRRLDPKASATEPDDPYVSSAGRVIPTLADAVPGGPGKALSLYFVVYPAPDSPGKPKLTMEFFDGETRLGSGRPELPDADAQGRIPYIATTPLDGFKPGQYEVRVTAEHGGSTDRQSIFVTIE
jgi:VWFA-related protein